MKSKLEILKETYATLAELEGTTWTNDNKALQDYLATKLTVLYDILGEDIPEEYWARIEKWTM